MTRKEAIELLHEHMKNQNLRRHCYAVEAVMGALYDRLIDGETDEKEKERWMIAGLLHDADYEETKETAKKDHTKVIAKWLEELDAETDVKDAIAAHAWNWVDDAPRPKTQMEWALYCCDELTGLIVAVALVKGAKLSEVTVDSVMKKFKVKSFAAGANREQIETCEDELNIPLRDFVDISLQAMQKIAPELGL